MDGLRVVSDETPPLSLSELQQRGNKLLNDARRSAWDALGISLKVDLTRQGSYTPAQVRQLRLKAHAAVTAWQEVEYLIAELVREFDKANNARRSPEAQ